MSSLPSMFTCSPVQGLVTVVVNGAFLVLVFEVVCARASGAQTARNRPAAHVATSTRRLGAAAVPAAVDRLASLKQLRRCMAVSLRFLRRREVFAVEPSGHLREQPACRA